METTADQNNVTIRHSDSIDEISQDAEPISNKKSHRRYKDIIMDQLYAGRSGCLRKTKEV